MVQSIGFKSHHILTGLDRPFWLSPRQVLVVPVAVPFREYASEVATKLSESGLFADVDNGSDTLPKKIRNGEIAQYNFILGTLH